MTRSPVSVPSAPESQLIILQVLVLRPVLLLTEVIGVHFKLPVAVERLRLEARGFGQMRHDTYTSILWDYALFASLLRRAGPGVFFSRIA